MSRTGLLGPLTTQFIPPATCGVQILAGQDAYLGQKCNGGGPIDDAQCWPVATRTLNPPFGGGGFYSPGYQCPQGYTSACAAVPSTTSLPNYAVSFNFQFPLMADETAIGCCPVGYSCTATPTATDAGAGFQQTCISSAPQTIVAASCVGDSFPDSLLTTTLPITSTATDPSGSESAVVINFVTYKAPLFQLNFQTLPPSASQALGVGSAPTAGNSNSSSTNDSGSSISGGAIAGIVVGVVIVVLASGAIAAFFLLRRRRRRKNGYAPEQNGKDWRDFPIPLHSQENIRPVSEHQYHELPTSGNTVFELDNPTKPKEVMSYEKPSELSDRNDKQ